MLILLYEQTLPQTVNAAWWVAHYAVLEGLGFSIKAYAGLTFITTLLLGRVYLEKGSWTVEDWALNDCQDKFFGRGLARLEVIPREVRAFRALLQNEIQLSVRHVYHLAVPRHLLDSPQDLHGSGYNLIDVINAHIGVHPSNSLCHFQVQLFFTHAVMDRV